MGIAKAELPFGPESLLARMIRLLEQVVAPVVVVRAVDQQLPPIPDHVRIVADRQLDQGPLEGLAVGLAALADAADAVFAVGCDLPLLTPDFVTGVIRLLGEHQAAVPEVDGFLHPLAAAYRTDLVPHLEQMLAAGKRRTTALFEHIDTRRIAPEELSDVDPQGCCLRNCNRPEDYLQALEAAGFSPEPEIARRLSKK